MSDHDYQTMSVDGSPVTLHIRVNDYTEAFDPLRAPVYAIDFDVVAYTDDTGTHAGRPTYALAVTEAFLYDEILHSEMDEALYND